MKNKLLQINQIDKFYNSGTSKKQVLSNINLELRHQDSMAIVGPSGCGKSTLLLIIAGLMQPSSGKILLDGKPVAEQHHKMALVLQKYGLFPWKTADENLRLGAKLQKIQISDMALKGLKNELGIQELDHLYPHQLSGGQQQRVALARALLLKPDLLLLDEPFAALDAITREKLQRHLLELFNHHQFSFIIVTHNIEEAVFLGKQIVVLKNNGNSDPVILNNPGINNVEYRKSDEFFKISSQVRQMMEMS